MNELWTALVELLTPPSYSDSGDTRCFTNVVAWAESSEDYTAAVSRVFEKSDCVVLSVEHCVRVSDCVNIPEDLVRQIDRAKAHPEDCIFGTLHYYSSPPS